MALGTVGVMALNDREVAHLFHDATKHNVESVGAGGHFLDFANMPIPLKHYPDLEPIPLPVDLPERAAPAVAVLGSRGRRAGAVGTPGAGPCAVLFAGVTRRARMVWWAADLLAGRRVRLESPARPGLVIGYDHQPPARLTAAVEALSRALCRQR